MDRKILISLIIGAFFVNTIFFSGCITITDDGNNTANEESHYECIIKKCKLVDGEGNDECEDDTDCKGDEEYKKTYSKCVEGYCEEVVGDSINECRFDSECRHNLCDDGECKEIYEVGRTECRYDYECE